jgi:hypothetical protein
MRRLSLLRPVARVLVGLFVLGQAVFLLAANAGALPGVSPETVSAVNSLTGPWADLTGQSQSWRLFAPDVADCVPFVTLDLRWHDRPPWRLPALNEPADPRHFFRLGNFRIRRAESALDVAPAQCQGFEPSGAAWRATLQGEVAWKQAYAIAYLGWRLAAFRREHPDLPPPAEVVLSMHFYRIPPPPGPEPWDWDDLGVLPVARWRPGSAALDVYDPRTDDFGSPPERGG